MKAPGTGLRALRYWEARQAALANNLANVSTPGFKAERVFARLLDERTAIVEGATDFSAGTLNATGRPLDVALIGDGFLVVETPQGRRWTRVGALSLDDTGALVDGAGHRVLGTSGPLVLPPGRVEVGLDGSVKVNGDRVGSLLVERSTDSAPLLREGSNLWLPSAGKEAAPTGEVQVRQGQLEESNVDPVTALVEMIEIQRAYSAVQRSMRTADGAMETITTRIGRVGG